MNKVCVHKLFRERFEKGEYYKLLGSDQTLLRVLTIRWSLVFAEIRLNGDRPLGPVEIAEQDSIIAIGLCRYNRQKINALKRRPCYEG